MVVGIWVPKDPIVIVSCTPTPTPLPNPTVRVHKVVNCVEVECGVGLWCVVMVWWVDCGEVVGVECLSLTPPRKKLWLGVLCVVLECVPMVVEGEVINPVPNCCGCCCCGVCCCCGCCWDGFPPPVPSDPGPIPVPMSDDGDPFCS